MTEGRKADRASKLKPGPHLIAQSLDLPLLADLRLTSTLKEMAICHYNADPNNYY